MTMSTTTGAVIAPTVALTAFHLDKPEDWQDRVMGAATGAGAGAIRKGASCVLWNPKHVASWQGLGYADGVQVVRQWFGPQSTALAFLPRRVYFEIDSDVPANKPEWALAGGSKPPSLPPARRIVTCLEFARWLHKRVPGISQMPMPIGRVRHNLHQRTRMTFGGGNHGVAGEKVSNLLTRYGAHTVPAGMQVELLAEDVRNPKVTSYRQLIESAFLKCRCTVGMTVVSYVDALNRLEAGTVPDVGYCALVAVTGKKGEALTPEASRLIETLQVKRVPFRMFSLDNPALRWSALDQVGSLLMGAGGIPYVLELPWPETITPPYILGVDLGHPKTRQASWVVMSLCDSKGTLIESWRHRQKLNETIGPAGLRAGLNWALTAAQMHGGVAQPGFLVIRDGRLHEGEKVQAYRQILGSRLTFVELAKYENPEVFMSSDTLRPVPAGTECLPEGAITPLIVPVSPRLAGDLARTLKLHMAPDWDGLGMGMDKIAEIVTGLSYAPGLGLATHALPGPIYWADGIAAIGETNHQFAGQRITAYPTTPLRD